MADLIDELKRRAPEFGFFRAVSLLTEYFRKKSNDTSPLNSGRIRFTPDLSITFPPSDITGASADAESVRLMLSFMGLLGVSSPLPNYFIDYIARYPDNGAALADFCSIFNNRLYALFYGALCKYRIPLAVSSPAFLHRLALLAGNPSTEQQTAHWRMCAYAGMLSTRRRNAAGLSALLADFFGGIPVHITQWVPRRVRLPNPTKLGGDGAALGVNTTIGTETLDFSGKFRVTLGPLRRELFESFLEGSDNLAAVRRLVASYLTDPLAFDIEVVLAAADLAPVVLGGDNARLGRTSALGECRPGAVGDEYAAVFEGTG